MKIHILTTDKGHTREIAAIAAFLYWQEMHYVLDYNTKNWLEAGGVTSNHPIITIHGDTKVFGFYQLYDFLNKDGSLLC